MKNVTSEHIKEIAEELDCGFQAFIHRQTGEIIFVPDSNFQQQLDLDSWDEDFKKLKQHKAQFCEIQKWTSKESYSMMTEFAEQLSDRLFQNKLLQTLQNKNPFREFTFAINNSGSFREQWFVYKNTWQQSHVANQLRLLGLC